MNITYLIGAGASANAIRPVDGMKKSILDVCQQLKNYTRSEINEPTFEAFPAELRTRIDLLPAIIGDLSWMISEAAYHSTIDTLAKKFYLTGDFQSLLRLKRALITYFVLKQLCVLRTNPLHNNPSPIEEIFDKRYDGFIATVASRGADGFRMPGNIKILSWNYDVQIELALKRYTPLKMHEIKERFQILPNHTSFDLPSGEILNQGLFAVVKLNGNAFWDNPSHTGEELKTTIFDKNYGSNRPLDVLTDLSWEYQWLNANQGDLMTRAASYFNFAWEIDENFRAKHAGHSNNLQAALEIASNTQILVVIGYSFPSFNREVDRRLFENMDNLSKVYIMDPNADRIRSTMENAFEIFQHQEGLGTGTIEFSLEISKDQFIIPYELG